MSLAFLFWSLNKRKEAKFRRKKIIIKNGFTFPQICSISFDTNSFKSSRLSQLQRYVISFCWAITEDLIK